MILGFDVRTMIGPDRFESSTIPDMDAALSSSSLYVYCDIIEHNIVGDSKVPLLRLVNVKGKHGERVYQKFTMPIYVPLQKHHFDTVEINIMTRHWRSGAICSREVGSDTSFQTSNSSIFRNMKRSCLLYTSPSPRD